MKIYCESCGQGTENGIKLPKFCSHCGDTFIKASTPPVKKVLKQARVEVPDDDDDNDDEEEDDSTTYVRRRPLPKLKGLSVEIEPMGKAQGSRLQDVMCTGEIGIKREVGEILTKEKVLENFKKEAGTLRPGE